jgi:uncharacterized membrane protein YcfT
MAARIAWVDYAKGWSIVLVVTMHSALGVGFAVGENGWLHEIVAFAKPFRMPDFFLVAGLFLGRIIDQPWRVFLDRKVVHFLYFYALWLLISLVIKSAGLNAHTLDTFLFAYLLGFVEPFSSMWFVYMLPILFVVMRLVKNLPAILILGVAISMHILAAMVPEGGEYAMGSMMTGWTPLDSFFLYFIYFACGHYFSARLFRVAQWVADNPGTSTSGLIVWAIVEEVAVKLGVPAIPGFTILFGFIGAVAIVALSVLAARVNRLGWLALCGRNSLVIYLSFFVPMATTRILMLKVGVVADVGWVSLIVAVIALTSPLVLHATVRGTAFAFLFARPSWARL